MKNLNFNPSKYSSQPETFRVSRTFKKSPKAIWKELINHENMVNWMPGISSVKVTHNQDGEAGLGCKRVCQFGSEALYEDIILWKENVAYGYKVQDNSLLEDHVAYVTIEDLGNGKSEVTWIQHLKPKGNFLKKFMMKNIMLPRTLKKGLANLESRVAA